MEILWGVNGLGVLGQMKECFTFTLSAAVSLDAVVTFLFTGAMGDFRAFLFSEAVIEGDLLTLDARESHHLVRVLRAKRGDGVVVLDGCGQRYVGSILRADAKAVGVAVATVESARPPACRVTLLQSIPKGKTMDLILRMATEIGVSTVQPVFTDQGEVQIKGERLASKVEKWRTTMIEACKQCGVSYLPELAAPVALRDWLAAYRPGAGSLGAVASLEDGSRPLGVALKEAGAVKEIVVAVGPEGDFTAAEYAALRGAGFQAVRLGANVLRSETAAAYILSVVDQSFTR
jgi:16S rRNA (uracil1498-N3)-methyltransferase